MMPLVLVLQVVMSCRSSCCHFAAPPPGTARCGYYYYTRRRHEVLQHAAREDFILDIAAHELNSMDKFETISNSIL